MRVTYAHLVKWGACEDQRDLAALHFGRSVVLTRNVLLEMAALGLDISFLARRILPPDLWATYEKARAPLWATYEKARAPLWATYEKGCAPLRATYEKGCAPLRATYLKARAPLWATYEKGCDSLWATCNKGCAPLLADALNLPVEATP